MSPLFNLLSSLKGVWYHPPHHTHTLSLFFSPPRVPWGVSMETRKRQRSVPQSKVRLVGERGSAEIFQQAGRKHGFLHINGMMNLFTVLSFVLHVCVFLKAREPKATMKIETLNATFQPAKIGNPCGLQITYLKDNSTRNIFVYHSDAKVQSYM